MTFQNNKQQQDSNNYNYIKEYSTFEEGYAELISIIPEIKLYGGETALFESVVNKLMKTVQDNLPSVSNPNYPNTYSFSISAREVGFLTDDSLAFSWRVFINKRTDEKTYQFRVSFISLSMAKKKYIELLLNNGFTQLDPYKKQSRFWHQNSNRVVKPRPQQEEAKKDNSVVTESDVIAVFEESEIKPVENTEDQNNEQVVEEEKKTE